MRRYLETYKTYENKPADQLQERTSDDYLTQLTAAMTTVRSVNKTDVITLVTTFGSFADVANASTDELRLCPGLGESKASRLHSVFAEPFFPPGTKRPNRFPLSAAKAKTSDSEAAVATVGDVHAAADKTVLDSVEIDLAHLHSDEEPDIEDGAEALD